MKLVKFIVLDNIERMFSALKRLVSNQNDQGNRPVVNDGYKAPHGVSVMDHNLQKKFAKGVQYNSKYKIRYDFVYIIIQLPFFIVKIVIKGDRNVGKTCLFLRLKGEKFKEEYDPTDEIQVFCCGFTIVLMMNYFVGCKYSMELPSH